MLNNGGFSQPCNAHNCLATASGGASSFSAYFVNRPHLSLIPKPSSSISTRALRSISSHSKQFRQTYLCFRVVVGERRGGSCVFARKKGRKGGDGRAEEVESEDEAEVFDDFEDEDFEDGDEEDDEDVGVISPFDDMKKWLVNKPSGFGEGKAYDTSVEEKLLEELERSKKAQAANIRNLKNNPVNPNSKKEDKKKKAPEVIPNGFRVRVTNLPKKRNIHRDLKSAFEGVPGVISITPAVSGNKKTRDPICKGFAFVDFKFEQDASRFVEIFSQQAIAFGKVQKQVKYEIVNSRSSRGKSSDASNFAAGPRLPIVDRKRDTRTNMDESSRERTSNELVIKERNEIEDDNRIMAEMEDTEDNDLIAAELGDAEDDEFLRAETEEDTGDGNIEPSTKREQQERTKVLEQTLLTGLRGEKFPKLEVSGSTKGLKMKDKVVQTNGSKQQEKSKSTEKKQKGKGKGEKGSKVTAPASAKRLRVREKAVLTEVFMKYGGKEK